MVEVTIVCELCHKEFARTATTDDEIKQLQRSIWSVTVCPECAAVADTYWE